MHGCCVRTRYRQLEQMSGMHPKRPGSFWGAAIYMRNRGRRGCWWIKTNAMPVSVGKAFSISVNASNPPAEAPMSTIGKDMRAAGPSSDRRAAPFFLVAILFATNVHVHGSPTKSALQHRGTGPPAPIFFPSLKPSIILDSVFSIVALKFKKSPSAIAQHRLPTTSHGCTLHLLS